MISVSNNFKQAVYAPSRKTKAKVIVKLDNDLVFDDKLIKLDIIEEMSVISDRLPSNEVKFVVDNVDKAFDILNPKGQYSIFQEGQEVVVEISVETGEDQYETIPMGKYYLKEWRSDEGTLTATFIARDILDILTKDNYLYATIESTNLHDVAVNVLTAAGVSNYSIDENLRLIPTLGYMPIMDFRKALQLIAIIGRCAVYSDRTGVLTIKQFETLDRSSNYINFCGGSDIIYCGVVYPMVDKEYELKNINYDNIYKDPKIELSKEIKVVDINVNDYAAGEEIDILTTTVNIQGIKQITLEYKDAPFVDVIITVDNCTSYEVIKNGANACLLSIEASGDVVVKARGKKVKNMKSVYSLVNNDLQEGTTVTIDNTLVNDINIAKDVAEWILKEGKFRAAYNINWRQNPCLECGDVVLVEDSFNAKKESRIIKQEFSFQGYLSGKTQTKGGL